MKRSLSIFAASLLLASPYMASAQESETSTDGLAALESTGRAGRWQNWVFAGTIIAVAAITITLVALNEGVHEH